MLACKHPQLLSAGKIMSETIGLISDKNSSEQRANINETTNCYENGFRMGKFIRGGKAVRAEKKDCNCFVAPANNVDLISQGPRGNC